MSIAFSPEIFDRTTSASGAEGTTNIAGLGTSCSFILSFASGTDVEAPLILPVSVRVIAVHFSLNHGFVCREGDGATVNIGYNACLSSNSQSVVSGTIRIPHSVRSQNPILILHFRVIGNIVLSDTAVIHPTLCHPDANRQFGEDCCVNNFFTGTSKGDNCIIMVVDIVFSLETISNLHTLQFPIIDIVKINGNGHGINLCKIISNHIEPENRTCR